MQPSWRAVGAAYGLLGLLLVAGHALVRPGVTAELFYTAISVLVWAAIEAGVRRHRPQPRRPWQFVRLGMAATVLASALWVVFLLLDWPTAPLGLLYLAAWISCIAAAWALTRVRTPRRDWGTALDVAIVTTGAGILLYVFVVQPTWTGLDADGLGRIIASLYPMFGLALIAILGRLAFGGAARVPAFWLLCGAVTLLLVADLVHATLTLSGSGATTGPASIRLLGFVLLGATALHPTMARLTDDQDPSEARLSRPRLLALWAASVAAPVTLLVRTGFGDGAELPVVALGSVALFTLVVARLWDLLNRHARLLRREHEDRFRALVEHAEDVIFLLDGHGRATYVSSSVRRTFGFEPDQVLGAGGLPMDSETSARVRAAIAGLRAQGRNRPVRIEGRVQHADGVWRNTEAVLVDRRDDPAIDRIVVTVRDVTAQWELQQQLAHQAFHDALTTLPNRALFVDRARQALDVRRPDGTLCAVLFLDLDDFKTVNDGLGHDQGDALLRTVADRLAAVVRASDTVARFGGDEFAVLVPHAVDLTVVTALAERILQALTEPIVLAGRPVSPAGSIGIAVSGGGGSVDELLRDADAAMYAAKRQGKGSFRLFDPGMHAQAMHRLQLREELHGAVDRGELSVVHQPIHDLATGEVAGIEALLRWRHPVLGQVAPAEFIPIAEESGRIDDLGAFVLHTACADVQQLRRTHPDLFLTVNVSPLQLERPAFVEVVRTALDASGLPAPALLLELTERVLLEESEAVADTVARLREIGVRLAIDDFGTGYCSLAYLTRLPYDVIKVDQSFVALLDDPAADHRVTIGILELIGSLAVPAVAEGIETARQLALLQDLGCRFGQGFLWGEPVPVDRLALARPTAAAGS